MTAGKTISFARGAPSLDIVDVEGLKAAAEAPSPQDPGGLTAYGTSVGYLPLREWIADKHGVAPEHVIVTNGSMQADAFLFDALVSPGDTVIVELPTYDRTLLSLRNRGADVRMVELEPDGIDVAALERVLATGARPKLAHIIPNFQNPAGYTLSLAKRERLLELAREYELRGVRGRPVRRAALHRRAAADDALDGPGERRLRLVVLQDGRPGIRVGYLVGPREVIAKIEKLATGTYISPNMVAQGIVNQFARSGAIDTLDRDRQERAARARRRRCPQRSSVSCPRPASSPPEGGYFMWVELPRGTDVDALFDAAAERGVQFVKGSDFVLEGYESSLRLAYSGVTPAEIEEGVSRLAEAYREVPAVVPRRLSGRSGRGRARAARAARSAAAARGRR